MTVLEAIAYANERAESFRREVDDVRFEDPARSERCRCYAVALEQLADDLEAQHDGRSWWRRLFAWRPRREARPVFKTIDDIRPPDYKFRGMDEGLRTRAIARRDEAERLRVRAAKADSGKPAGDAMRVVRR